MFDITCFNVTIRYRMQLHSEATKKTINLTLKLKTFMEINTFKISTNTKRDYFEISILIFSCTVIHHTLGGGVRGDILRPMMH